MPTRNGVHECSKTAISLKRTPYNFVPWTYAPGHLVLFSEEDCQHPIRGPSCMTEHQQHLELHKTNGDTLEDRVMNYALSQCVWNSLMKFK